MSFKHLGVIVLWMKVALASEGLKTNLYLAAVPGSDRVWMLAVSVRADVGGALLLLDWLFSMEALVSVMLRMVDQNVCFLLYYKYQLRMFILFWPGVFSEKCGFS